MATRTRKKAARKTQAGAAAAQQKLLDMVHQVWLAGLGAASKAQKGAPKLFQELVTEGAHVHADAVKAASSTMQSMVSQAQTAIRGGVDDVREKASDTLESLEKIFQTRVQRAMKQLGVPGSREIEQLSKRVDVLNANIEKLARTRRTGRRSSAADGKRAASDARVAS